MIGRRLVVATVALVTVVALGAGGPRPEVEAAARGSVVVAAEDVLALASDLRARLLPAVESARTGAARVVAGTEPPGGPLLESSSAVLESASVAVALGSATGRLERARRAWRPGVDGLPEPPDAADLSSISAQLAATAEAGEAFALMRRRAEGLTGVLAAALRDAESGDVAGASERVEAAQEEAEVLRAWEIDAVTLPVWLETVDAMIEAMDRTVDALANRDDARARDAVEAFGALAERAPSADRALRIAVGEAGGALTATALNRLAGSLVALDELARAAASVRDEALP
jgi:hypothetical protein